MENEQKLSDVSSSTTWETFYGDGKTGWERHEVHPALVAWLDSGLVKPPCHIAIPGCGRGGEPLELAKRGFDVTAIDFADTAVDYQTEQLKDFAATASATSHDVFNFVPPVTFDVVYEQTCLCAIAPDRRSEYEQSVFRWLKPGGLLLALFMQTGRGAQGPPFHCDLADMQTLFPSSRWQWKIDTAMGQMSSKQYNHPSGKIFEFAFVLERKDTHHVG